MRRELTTVLDGCSYLECPRWHDGRVWVSDLYTHRVLSVVPGGDPQVVAKVPKQPSGLGFLPDGRLLIVSMKDRRILRLERDGRLLTHADLADLAPYHLNDMVVDGKGRAYVGNFGFDLMGHAPAKATCLIGVDPRGQARIAAKGLMFPNGIVVTPDGRTLIVAETMGHRLSAYDIHPDGRLMNPRLWAPLGRHAANEIRGSIVPDGICLDSRNAVWVADAEHPRVVRVAEGGRRLEQIDTGDIGVYACMLGGREGRTLFLCCAPSYLEHERSRTRDAKLLAVEVDVPRAGWP